MNMNLPPWKIDPSLQPERLQALALEAKNARNRVIDLAVEELDDEWTIGCRAYRWTCVMFTKLTARDDCRWLRTRQKGLEFTFYVDEVAFKFYRGNSEDPKSSSLRSGVREMLSANRFAFLDDEISKEIEGWFWLLAIDTDVDGRTLEVVVLQANAQGEVRHPWSIPLDGRVVAIAPITSVRRDGVEQAPAEIGVPGDEVRAANDYDNSHEG